MKIVPFNRNRDFYPMKSLFDDFWNRFSNDEREDYQRIMPIDILEHEDHFEVQANLPGFKKQDIKMTINENELVIEANREEDKEEVKGSYCRCERYRGNYHRVISLSETTDRDKIDAKFEDGVLIVNIPKIEPKPAKEIKIG